ncbi:MAG TPA: lysylphosphatidylglycerol synthase transmembrane domain-containing protein [Solirubrobacteraceae bacterium]
MRSFAVELGALYHHGEALVGKLGEISLIPFAVALALHLTKLGVRARAWHNIVRAAYPADRPRFRHSLGAFLAGTGVGACVPAQAGQLVRLGLLRSRVSSSSFPGLISTLIAESVFDAVLTALIAISVLIAAGPGVAGGASFPGPLGQHPVIAGLTAVAVTLVGCGLAVHRRARIRSLLRDARIGLAVFAQPARYLRGVASWQTLGCTLRVASTYWFLVAFHVPASLHAALLVIAVQLVAGAVPLTPGGAGSQQAILIAALSPTTTSTVLGFGIGTQVTTMLADLVLGGASLILMTGSLRWRRIARADQPCSVEDPSPGAVPSPTGARRPPRLALSEEQRDIDTEKNRCDVAGPPQALEVALLQASTPTAGPPPT